MTLASTDARTTTTPLPLVHTLAGFAASGKGWDFTAKRVVEWPDPLVRKFELARGGGDGRGPGGERGGHTVIALNRKALSKADFAFAKSAAADSQSQAVLKCLPSGEHDLAPLMALLPKDDPFRAQKFGSCAVVGNSGILRTSLCGADIDSHDVVFRINEGRTGHPPRGGFRATDKAAERYGADVGNRTTIRVILGELAGSDWETAHGAEAWGGNALYMDPPGTMRMLAWPCPQGDGHVAYTQQSHVREKILKTISEIRADKRAADRGIMFLSPEPLMQLRRSLGLSPGTADPSLGLQIAAASFPADFPSLFRCSGSARGSVPGLVAPPPREGRCARLCWPDPLRRARLP